MITLNNLVEEAMQRAADRSAEEARKRAEQALAIASIEKKSLARRAQYVGELLPSPIWAELGLDLTKLCQQTGNPYNYCTSGQLTLVLNSCHYKADTSVVASYPQRIIGHKPKAVYLNIKDERVKLHLPGEVTIDQCNSWNLIGLGEVLHELIEKASVRRAREIQERKIQVQRSLDAEDLSSKKCQSFIDKLEKCTWPRQDIEDLLERARIRLESIKAREADALHDQKLAGEIWEMAKAHVAESSAYGFACAQWAEQMIEKHWHPFTLFALRYAVSDNNTETVYCLSDKPDDDGFLKMVAPDGTIIEKRFCRPISWQKETFDKKPDHMSASYCHYQIQAESEIPTWWGSFTVNLPPAAVHNREIDPAAIRESQPSQPISWQRRIESVCNLFINKEWADRIHDYDPEDIAESEMSTWFRKVA